MTTLQDDDARASQAHRLLRLAKLAATTLAALVGVAEAFGWL